MKKKCSVLIFGVLYVFLFSGCATVQPVQGTVAEHRIGKEMVGHIDWEKKMVYAVGHGVMPPDAISPAQARVRAKRAAIDTAFARLLETVQEVQVDSESTTRYFVHENNLVRTTVQGMPARFSRLAKIAF